MSNNVNQLPLISILMPAYNHAYYVQAAVESVLAQTWANLELIAIDDCSTDETPDILQEYADQRIRTYRHKSNLGSHATLNEALDLARGDFIAIINSDDIYSPDRILSCINEIESSGADMIGTDIVLIDETGRPVDKHWWIDAFMALKTVLRETSDWHATLLEGNVFMTTSNFFFRRRWLDVVGGFHNLHYVLDYDWLLRGLGKGLKITWLESPLLRYRLHKSNTICERPLAANLECTRMLRGQLPHLLGTDPDLHQRLSHLTSQWARLEKYLGEIAATQQHEALVAKENELFPLIADRDRWIGERDQLIAQQAQWIADRDRWIAERDDCITANLHELSACRDEMSIIRSSRSYRLGCALTAPARWFYRVFPHRSRH